MTKTSPLTQNLGHSPKVTAAISQGDFHCTRLGQLGKTQVMSKSPRTLRQKKLWWCAAHNAGMSRYPNAPVTYLVDHMPTLLDDVLNRVDAAKSRLDKYLGDEKPDYWKTRPDYIQEICAALSISRECWDDPDFDRFSTEAKIELKAAGLLKESAVLTFDARRQAVRRLESFPRVDGREVIDLLPADTVLGFTRKRRESDWPQLSRDREVKMRFLVPRGAHVLAFTIDPQQVVELVTPAEQEAVLTGDGEALYFPGRSESGLFPPPKGGWHELLVLFCDGVVPKEIQEHDSEHGLSPSMIDLLSAFIERRLAAGETLYEIHFYVAD